MEGYLCEGEPDIGRWFFWEEATDPPVDDDTDAQLDMMAARFGDLADG